MKCIASKKEGFKLPVVAAIEPVQRRREIIDITMKKKNP